MTDVKTCAEEIRRALRRRRRQHRAVHASAAPATICITAATTFSMSPKPANSRRSRICWCMAACRPAAELANYKAKLKSLRGLPRAVLNTLEQLPAAAHPMDVMRTGVSALGCVLPESHDHNPPGARDIADRLMASLGSMLLYWHHYAHHGRRIEVETDDDFDRRAFPASAARQAAVRLARARDAHLAQSSMPSTSSTPRPSPRARSPAPAPTSIRRSPAPSARCAGRNMAAPMRSRSRSRNATPIPTRPRPTSAAGSRPRKS